MDTLKVMNYTLLSQKLVKKSVKMSHISRRAWIPIQIPQYLPPRVLSTYHYPVRTDYNQMAKDYFDKWNNPHVFYMAHANVTKKGKTWLPRHYAPYYNKLKQQLKLKENNILKLMEEKRKFKIQYLNNRFSILPVQSGRTINFSEDNEIPIKIIKQTKRKTFDYKKHEEKLLEYYIRLASLERKTYIEFTSKKTRSVMLLYKLRKICYSFRNKLKWNCDGTDNYATKVQCESNVTSQGEGSVTEQTDSNVTLISQRDIDVAKLGPASCKWSNFVSNDVVDDFRVLTDRWFEVGTETWDKQDYRGKLLFGTNFPFFLMLDQQRNDQPSLIPFLIHTYWRGDMEFRLTVNSNKFQVGQLCMSWYYQPYVDKNFTARDDIYSELQRDHVLISASASNEASLYIPYKHPYPFLATRYVPTMSNKENILNLGRLTIRVLNPLAVSTAGPSTCNFTLFVRFINSEFTGMCHARYVSPFIERQLIKDNIIIKPEMEFVAMGAAMKLLDTYMPDMNRDNPPVVAVPNIIQPTAAHSLCIGTNLIEPINTLRLDARGQTRHPEGCNTNQQMTCIGICKKYGIIKILNWNMSNKRGDILGNFDAQPIHETLVLDNEYLSEYSIAPISAISSMFMQWRGTLKFRFDFISSAFHSGSLMIGYVPGAGDNKISINELRASSYIVYNLQEAQSITYEVPFITYKPWWIRSISGGYSDVNEAAPSGLYIMVLNPLIRMEAVTDSVQVNVYISAGDDFELSVPVQPAYGLTNNRAFRVGSTSTLVAKQGYWPYYSGSWHSFYDSDRHILRWGSLSDQIAQFNAPFNPSEDGGAYYTTTKENAITIEGAKVTNMIFVLSSSGYVVGIPIRTENLAIVLAQNIYYRKVKYDNPSLKSYYIQYKIASDYVKTNIPWSRKLAPKPTTVSQVKDSDDDFEEILNAEGQETFDCEVIKPANKLRPTNYGEYFYGESFNDLKNLLRRYQLFGQVYLNKFIINEPHKCCFYFPVSPDGINLDIGTEETPNEVFNRCREGIIPLIASAYRYYRGSIRFKIVLNGLKASMWVQHRPDRKFDENVITINENITTADSILNHGYAMIMQHTQVNPVIEFEVPFYNATCYNWLGEITCKDDSQKWATILGEVAVGIECLPSDKDALKQAYVNIYYSIGDDMTFSQWCGFPHVFKLNKFPTSIRVQSEGPLIEKIKLKYKSIININEDEVDVEVAPEGVKEWINDKVKTIVSTSLDDIKEEVSEAINSCSTGDTSKLGTFEKIYTYISELIHSLINPTLNTICYSIANVFIKLGIFVYDKVNNIMAILTKIFKRIVPAKQQTKADSSKPIPVGPEGQEEQQDFGAWISVLYTGVTAFLGICCEKPSTWGSWKRILTKDLGDNLRTSNYIFTFIKNTINCLKTIVHYIFGKTNSNYKLLQTLESDPEVVQNWAKEVLMLTDPCVRIKKSGQADYNNRVFDAQCFGQLIMHQISGELRSAKPAMIITKLFDKITLLKEELLNLGDSPHVRMMPFTIYMFGEPGIGKSEMSTSIGTALLKEIRYTTTRPLKCTINPLSKYWDQCEHQPILEIDDLWNVQEGEALYQQILTLFQVSSPIVLSPPMAKLEEKKMRYNPLIFYINSNYDFPRFNNVNKEAIWRRRDVLIQAKLSGRTIPQCPHCHIIAPNTEKLSLKQVDRKWLDDFHHLLFAIHGDVVNPEKEYGDFMSYNELMIELKTRFIAHYARAQQDFKVRAEQCSSLMPDGDEIEGIDNVDIHETFNLLQDRRQREYEKIKEHYLLSDIQDCCGIAKEKIKLFLTEGINFDKFRYKKKQVEMMKVEEDARYIECEALLKESISCCFKDSFKVDMILHFADHKIINVNESRSILKDIIRFDENNEQLNTIFKPIIPYIDRYILKYGSLKYGFKINNLFPILQGMDIECVHWRVDIKLVNAFKGILRLNASEVDLMIPCCQNCLLHSKWLKHNWCKYWLYSNPSIRINFNKGKYIGLPDYFHTKESVETILPENWFVNLLLQIKDFVMSTLLPKAKRVLDIITNHFPMILAGIGVLGCLTSIGACTYASVDMVQNPEKYSSVYVWTPEAVKYDSNTPSNIIAKHAVAHVPESQSQQVEVVEKLVMRNSCYIVCLGENGEKFEFRCLMLRNREMLIIRHYMDVIRKMKNTKFYFKFAHNNLERTHSATGIEIDLLNLDVRWYGGKIDGYKYVSNFGLLVLPVQIPECKNLVKFIATKDQHKNTSSMCILMSVGDKVKQDVTVSFKDSIPYIVCDDTDKDISEVIMRATYTYDVHGRGMCGSVLVANNLQNPIIGIHVAGSMHKGYNEYGMSEPIYREMFDDLPLPIHMPYDNICEMQMEEPDFATTKLETILYPYGKIPHDLVQQEAGISKIVPSIIHGIYPVTTAPMPLTKRDPRLKHAAPNNDPMLLGCAKHGYPPRPFDTKLLSKATADLREKILNVVKPLSVNVGVRSLQDAVCGVPDIEQFDAIAFNTSPGFPLNSSLVKPRNVKGKKWLFNLNETKDGYELLGVHDELNRLLKVTDTMRKRGIKPMTIFTDCLKDTTASHEKCSTPGKTRIFSISPIQFTIPFRRYFLDFMGAYRKHNLKIEHGIGIDVNSIQWHQLATKMSSKSKHIVTGDYKNFGPGMSMCVAEAAFEIIIDWYTKYSSDESIEENKIRWILAQEILTPYHLCRDLVYRVPSGIPSGSPITDILNSMVNCLYIRMAWLDITHKNLCDFNNNCELVVYGDDLIMNVSDNYIESFNAKSLHNFFDKYGIVFTDQDKSDNCIISRKLNTATFLKHDFRNHESRNIIIGALEEESIYSCLNWVRKDNDPIEAIKQNAVQACELAYGHGSSFHNNVRRRILDELSKRNIIVNIPMWEDIDVRCFSN